MRVGQHLVRIDREDRSFKNVPVCSCRITKVFWAACLSVQSRAYTFAVTFQFPSRGGHSSCQPLRSPYARAYFWRCAPAIWPNSVGHESCPATTTIPRLALKDPFVGHSYRQQLQFATPDSVPGADKYFRALRHLSVGRGPGNAFNDMHRLGRSPKRVASPHIQGQGLALSALAPGRSSRRPPRNHRVGRGPLVNNNEP